MNLPTAARLNQILNVTTEKSIHEPLTPTSCTLGPSYGGSSTSSFGRTISGVTSCGMRTTIGGRDEEEADLQLDFAWACSGDCWLNCAILTIFLGSEVRAMQPRL